ncbi:MAG: ABC transporter permease [Pseudomonadota bacterium]
MTGYYLRLAMISIRKHPAHTLLMIVAIALGVAVCMSMVTVNYLMAKNPIPEKSEQLFYVQLDNWNPDNAFRSPNDPPDQVTWQDARALVEAGQAHRQIKSASFSMVVEPEDPEIRPFQVSVRGTHADFFPMFNVPFLFGDGWSRESERGMFDSDLVVVLSKATNERLFGGIDSVGRDVRIGTATYRVVGVMDEWRPVPKFYDVTNNFFGNPEDVFMPFDVDYKIASTRQRQGSMNCWKPTAPAFRAILGSECVWMQMWVELRDSSEKEEYLQFLNNYVSEQKEQGRFERPMNNRLQSVTEWMDYNEIVQPEAKMMLAIAVMFLVVCLLNTVGLLLSKFIGKSAEASVRRALGASRATLFYQYLIETLIIGIAGGLLGLLLTWFALEAMTAMFGELASNLMTLDVNLMIMTIILAMASSIGAGLYPTWRACSIPPAAQLKSQ